MTKDLCFEIERQYNSNHVRCANEGSAIAEAIGSTRVTITRLLGDLKDSGLLNIERKKITVFDPIALAKRFN